MIRRALPTSTPHRLPRLALLCAALLALLLAGCGGGDEADGGPVAGTQLRIYSSLPLEGPDALAARDVVRAQEMALDDAGPEIGRYRIDLVPLDAATEQENRWDPAQISQNARRAAEDPDTIAYLGELNTGSSAISIPLLNEVGVLEVSPLDTAMALTARNLAVPDSPMKYFPKARDVGRTFARVVPSDRAQALAQLDYMRQEGVRRVVLLTDEDPAGVGYVTVIRPNARDYGIDVALVESVDAHQQDPRELVEKIRLANPDAVFYAGGSHEGAVRLWEALSVAEPGIRLFAPGSLVDAGFIEAVGAAATITYVTRPVLGIDAYPPAAQRFARRFEKQYGSAPQPEALYGYESASALLEAIRTSVLAADDGVLERAAVGRAFKQLRRRDTVLGDYEIQPSGDTSLERFGAYRVEDGQLRYVRPLSGAQPG